MAIQTDSIVISNSLLKIFFVSHTDFVSMRIMTFPACESVIFHLKVSTLLVFSLYFLKMIFSKFLVSAMTVNTIILLFHSKFSGVRKLYILTRMAVGTTEAFMI